MILTRTAEADRAEALPTARLEKARGCLRSASRNVQVTEGRLLDFETAEDIMRALHTAARELEALMVTVAVMQRREALDLNSDRLAAVVKAASTTWRALAVWRRTS
jgi:hypothetical protein